MIEAAQMYTITCDTCGFIINSNPATKFSNFITAISNNGWHFETNCFDKIKKVTCPKCEEKRKAELCKSTDIRARIFGGYYNDNSKLQFKEDALEDVGLTNHPKAEKAFELAWEHGHADAGSGRRPGRPAGHGYENVLCWLEELSDLLN